MIPLFLVQANWEPRREIAFKNKKQHREHCINDCFVPYQSKSGATSSTAEINGAALESC